MRTVVASALALLVLGEGQAVAATVAIEPDASGAPVLVVRAAPDEANRLVIGTTLFPVPAVQVTDAVTLTPGPGCQPATSPSGASEVRCSPEIAGIVVYAGDGDDEVRSVPSVPLTVDGGPGNDHLTGLGPTTLYGGDGQDELVGSAAPNALFAGPGHDTLTGDGGDDLLDASESTRADMEAGPGNDVLVGGGGDDFLDGDEGADALTGGPGSDDYTAGPGDDTLRTRDGVSEEVACGPGRDTIEHDITDYPERTAPRQCEGGDFIWPDVVLFWVKRRLRNPPISLPRDRRLRVDFKCARADCSGRVRLVRLLTRRHEVLYRRAPWTRIRNLERKRQEVRVRLNRRQHRHLTRRRWLVLNFFVETHDRAGRARYAVVTDEYLGDPTTRP